MPRTFVTQTLGTSVQSRNIDVEISEVADNIVRVLVYAGQHGDEAEARDSAQRLITDIQTNNPNDYNGASVAVIKNINPDGAVANQRENANGRDLNRNHLIQTEPEVRILYNFIRSWKPNVTIDAHNFPSTDTYLTSQNIAFSHDCMIDKPIHHIMRHNTMNNKQMADLITSIQTANSPYTFSRYVNPGDTGRLRFSTEDIIDGRHTPAFFYDMMSFIIEGREPLIPEETAAVQEERTKEAEFRAMKGIILWAKVPENANKFKYPVVPLVKGTTIPVSFSYQDPSGESYTLNMWNTNTDVIEPYTFKWFVYIHNQTKFVTVPLAYAIHETNESEVVTLLKDQHGLEYVDGQVSDQYNIETIHIDTANAWVNQPIEDQVPPTGVTTTINSSSMSDFSNYKIFNINQKRGHVLPILLEPLSEYGLPRYKTTLGLDVVADTNYSILRLITKTA